MLATAAPPTDGAAGFNTTTTTTNNNNNNNKNNNGNDNNANMNSVKTTKQTTSTVVNGDFRRLFVLLCAKYFTNHTQYAAYQLPSQLLIDHSAPSVAVSRFPMVYDPSSLEASTASFDQPFLHQFAGQKITPTTLNKCFAKFYDSSLSTNSNIPNETSTEVLLKKIGSILMYFRSSRQTERANALEALLGNIFDYPTLEVDKSAPGILLQDGVTHLNRLKNPGTIIAWNERVKMLTLLLCLSNVEADNLPAMSETSQRALRNLPATVADTSDESSDYPTDMNDKFNMLSSNYQVDNLILGKNGQSLESVHNVWDVLSNKAGYAQPETLFGALLKPTKTTGTDITLDVPHLPRRPKSFWQNAYEELNATKEFEQRQQQEIMDTTFISSNGSSGMLDVEDLELNSIQDSGMDVWSAAGKDVPSGEKKAQLRTWDDLVNESNHSRMKDSGFFSLPDTSDVKRSLSESAEFKSPYVSEADLDIVDAIYKRYYSQRPFVDENGVVRVDPEIVVDEEELMKELVYVALGTSSKYFPFDDTTERFILDARFGTLRLRGRSKSGTLQACEPFLVFGTHLRRLATFTEMVFASPSRYGLCHIAFARCIEDYLGFVHGLILARSSPESSSHMNLIELYHSIQVPEYVIAALARLCHLEYELTTPSFDSLPKGTELLSYLCQTALSLDYFGKNPKSASLKTFLWTAIKSVWWVWGGWVKKWIGIGHVVLDNSVKSTSETNSNTSAPKFLLSSSSTTAFGSGEDIGKIILPRDDCGDVYEEFFIKRVRDSHDEIRAVDLIHNSEEFWYAGWQIDSRVSLPIFFDAALIHALCQSGKALRLLRQFCPRHPVLQYDDETAVEWAFTDSEAVAVQENVQKAVKGIVRNWLVWERKQRERVERYQAKLVAKRRARLDYLQKLQDEDDQRRTQLKEQEQARKQQWAQDVQHFLQAHAEAKDAELKKSQSRVDLFTNATPEQILTKQRLELEAKTDVIIESRAKFSELAKREKILEWRKQRFALNEKRVELLSRSASAVDLPSEVVGDSSRTLAQSGEDGLLRTKSEVFASAYELADEESEEDDSFVSANEEEVEEEEEKETTIDVNQVDIVPTVAKVITEAVVVNAVAPVDGNVVAVENDSDSEDEEEVEVANQEPVNEQQPEKQPQPITTSFFPIAPTQPSESQLSSFMDFQNFPGLTSYHLQPSSNFFPNLVGMMDVDDGLAGGSSSFSAFGIAPVVEPVSVVESNVEVVADVDEQPVLNEEPQQPEEEELKPRQPQITAKDVFRPNKTLSNMEHLLTNTTFSLSCVTTTSLTYSIRCHIDLIDKSVLSWVFHHLKYPQHLKTLGDYFLMRDGMFVTRLQNALFGASSSFASEQGIGLVAGIGGLGLNLRKKVPDSIEWSVALKEVIESPSNASLDDDVSDSESDAIMNDVEEEMIRKELEDERDLSKRLSFVVGEPKGKYQIDAAEVTDFLSLAYNAPLPLPVLITPSIQSKYNRVFSFLLRMLRVSDALTHLTKRNSSWWRQSSNSTSRMTFEDKNIALRFRHEATSFLNALEAYVYDVGIGKIWQVFMKKMEEMGEKCRYGDDAATTTSANGHGEGEGGDKEVDELCAELFADAGKDFGPLDENSMHGIGGQGPASSYTESMNLEGLYRMHHQYIDTILFRTLLKTKQQPVMKVVNSILGLILVFCRRVGELDGSVPSSSTNPAQKEVSLRKLYESFRVRVGMFTNVLRGLVEKEVGGGTRSVRRYGMEMTVFEDLLVRMDFTRFIEDKVVPDLKSLVASKS